MMSNLNTLILASGMSLALSIGFVPAQAADSAGDTAEAPTADQIKKSKQRELLFVPLAPKAQPRGVFVTPPLTPNTVKSAHPNSGADKPGKKPPVAVQTTTAAATSKSTAHAPQAVPPHKQHTSVVTSASPVHTTANASAHTTKASTKTADTPKSSPTTVLASTDDSGANVLKAWLNKSGTDPHYKKGERMEINVSTDRDCNVVIFDFDGKGTLTQLFPNQYQPNGALKSGETVTVGGQASPFDYTANLEDGQQRSEEKLFVYAYPTEKETPLSVAMGPASSTPFRSSKLTPAEYKKMVAHAPSFFQSQERNVKITPKSNLKMVNADLTQAPNKIELPVVIER